MAGSIPGITESNITTWRRAVAGDLTSAFNFASPNDAKVPLPSTAAYQPPDDNRHPDYIPAPPSDQALPAQEPGVRPARALPYELHVEADVNSQAPVELRFRNTGKAAAVFHVRSGDRKTGPWTYTVGVRDEVSDHFGVRGDASYDLSVYGANGFLRTFTGGANSAKLKVKAIYDVESEGIALEIRNEGRGDEKVRIVDAYSGKTVTQRLEGHETFTHYWPLKRFSGWYDLTVTVESDATFQRQLAGHVETGCDSVTDPMIGAAAAQPVVA
ncbi:phospholipase domain-containing protein [Acidobacterium sp. S8]|uniref:phospholipase domain-containing protein n=1 Tax=Acidobacterium sp. S8 TaxID=1641854 RepID=UPI0020B131C7|nr:phospholipase domain-containing protein [Acidobacterium sp. S8]